MLRHHVIFAVFKRNLLSYFIGVLGYLFIVVFVVAGAYLAFNARFFTNNLANLDQLNQWFPMLLLFIVPAITMSTWADEKKMGTDELLFTLPASDVEILLGKYLAVLAVYTVTLLFSITHLGVLGWYADPDWGMLFCTYFGYWISGAALLSAGMFASVLTSSTTVAFVLGAAICSIPIFIGNIASSNEFLRSLSLSEQFREFGMGMLPLGGILYFVSLTVFMLYLNLVFISKRHWSGSQQANMGLQFVVRSGSLAAILISLNALAGYGTIHIDMTAEHLYSLSDTTKKLIGNVKETERPITIQAFLSPDVPREYVPVRKRLIGLLQQYDHLGGQHIEVRYVDVTPFSEAAEEAKLFGIEPVRIHSERDGRRLEEDVFLGTVITSNFDEVVIPFFGAGTPIEYELTRSIRTVSNEDRITIGILRTDAGLLGSSREWQIVTELKQQYNVEDVSPDSEIDEDQYKVLIAVLPSSLTQPQMTNLVDYVKKGKPVLIFDDPFPWVFNSGWGVTNAPRQPKPSPGGGMGGMFGMNRQQAPPKADGGRSTSLLNVLEIAWDNGEIVFDLENPHPEFLNVVPPEYLFIASKKGVPGAINKDSEITGGLQELLAAFCGRIRPREDSKVKFEPLLRTGLSSGRLQWEEFTSPSFDMSRMTQTAQLNSDRTHIIPFSPEAHVLAAHLTSDNLNAVYVADVDMISDWFFLERSRGDTNLKLDNVTFVLNAVDVLAGDNSYLDLRKRRAAHRTLKEVERQTSEFVKERNKAQAKADDDAKKALDTAKQRLIDKIAAIKKDESLSEQQKFEQVRMWEAYENRRLEVERANIERNKKNEIEKIKTSTERKIQQRENQLRIGAVVLSPLPAILLGIVILSTRLYNEQRNISPDRLVHK